jgi:sialate O-acetylesterase
MIGSWRAEWGIGDFPFYWVQLADFRAEQGDPVGSDWAELREAQTLALSLPNTGQAVITDLGEADDIHPRNKLDVAKRLARWALAKDYGFQIVHRSPEFQSLEIQGEQVVLTFDHVGGGLDTFDVRQPVGFSVAGEDRIFHWATKSSIVGKNQITLECDAVSKPVAVRYAWADNPVCNVQNKEGLPLTPFRSDQWPGVTVNTQ